MRPTLAIEPRVTTTWLLLCVLRILLRVRGHVTRANLLATILITLLSETSNLVNALIARHAGIHAVADTRVRLRVVCSIGLIIWTHY